MKYYVVSDIHSYYNELEQALEEKGFFSDTGPHKLVICGDLFDRGKQVHKLQGFILDLLEKKQVILIKGNHEDLMEELIENFYKYLPIIERTHHYSNGTYQTAVALSNMKESYIAHFPNEFIKKVTHSPFFQKILPEMVDYFETKHYLFVHGWIPCYAHRFGPREFTYTPDVKWRKGTKKDWEKARWYNGMAAHKCGVCVDKKTIICGHFHCSWGHSVLDGKGSEYDSSAIFEPYCKDGIIAIDACTAISKRVNCIIIED
jgi:serine/threonine protein phosphatase 1